MLVEIQDQRKTSTVMILDVKGYYMYGGLPLVKMRFMELDRNSADLKTSKETTTIYVKYRRCVRKKSHGCSCMFMMLMLNTYCMC